MRLYEPSFYPARNFRSAAASDPFPLRPATPAQTQPEFGNWWDHMMVRLIFSIACVAAGYHFHPFGLSNLVAAGVGLAFSISVFLFEIRLQRASMRRLIGAAIGSILGILGAYLMGLVLARTSIPEGSRSFMDVGLLLVMTYIGLVVGANKGDMLNLAAARRPVRQRTQHAAHAQSAGHQRDYRRPHRGYLRGPFPGRRPADPAIRLARIAIRGRFRRFA